MIHIISRGRVGTAERVIDMVVQRDGTAACVVCGNIDFPLPIALPPLDVSLLGSDMRDSYDSREGPYSPATAKDHGNVFSNGDVSLTGTVALPVNVKGTVTAGATCRSSRRFCRPSP